MLITISVVIFIVCILLGLIVLAQNPKGGGLAQGFTGAQQIGGVQKTANFLEKGTWGLATALLVLCLVSAAFIGTSTVVEDEFDAPIQVPGEAAIPTQTSPDAGAASQAGN